MLASVLFTILAVTIEPRGIPYALDAHATQRLNGEFLGSSQLHTVASTGNSTLDAAATVDTPQTASTRGKPRVSKTRCAVVGCGSQCDIKGLRDAQGTLIYRTPANPAYARANAERMFCSRADVKEAGYREEQQG